MSWSDILYPDNPRRREDVVRKIQKLLDSMDQDFYTTNQLTDLLNKDVEGANFSNISVDETKSLKENADVLLNQIKKIDKCVEKIDEELKEKLDPELYRKLIDVDTSFEERVEIGLKVVHIMAGITGVAVTGVVGKMVAQRLTASIASQIGRIAASTVAGAIAGGALGLGIDVIAGAIAGAYERDNLEEAIEELDKDIESFIPASRDYRFNITKVIVEVEHWIDGDKK